MSFGRLEICTRLKQLRERHFGPRGRSRFARELGIRPSTYSHYEETRLPPVDLLVEAARITGTSLDWLVTGTEEPRVSDGAPAADAASQLADRLRQLLAARPGLAGAVASYLEALERVPAGPATPVRTPSDASHPAALIPLVGSTAAGPARFWENLPELEGGPAADARLERLLADQLARSAAQPGILAAPADAGGGPVALVQCSMPDDRGLLEFVSAASVKARYPAAVAWRIDGDSMAPRYRDGDLVITSPDQPAVDDHPCVARQAGQIGVNCKIFRREGEDIVLIPINERYPVQRFPAKELAWASRVLCSVRLG